MATPETQAPPALRITRTLPAPRERVFRAWTDPQALKRWFAPGAAYMTEVPELDAHVGGRFRIAMKAPDGVLHVARGVFREVRSPERLSFTWSWEGEPDMGDSLVTVELADRGSLTELTLTHEGLPTEIAREKHAHGWNGCLGQLEGMLS
jgi:uncharacterized protein YndB with AHSA1/START domain